MYIIKNNGKRLDLNQWVVPASGGTGGSVSGLVVGEIPVGDIDGINASFAALNNFDPATLQVMYNGQVLTLLNDFTSTLGRFVQLLFSPRVGTIVTLNYQKT